MNLKTKEVSKRKRKTTVGGKTTENGKLQLDEKE